MPRTAADENRPAMRGERQAIAQKPASTTARLPPTVKSDSSPPAARLVPGCGVAF